MATATRVNRTLVVAALRSQDLHGRADWVERELPPLIDTASNASLMRTLGVDLAALAPEALAPDVRPIHSKRDAQPVEEDPHGE